MTYFVAPYSTADRISKGGGLAEESEDIEVIETTLDAAIAMVERGEIVDVKTIALLYYARATGLMGRPAEGRISATNSPAAFSLTSLREDGSQ